MTENDGCIVADTLSLVEEALKEEGLIKEPRARLRAEKLLKLLEDVSRGRGGEEHFDAMTTLGKTLQERPDEGALRLGREVHDIFERFHEVFRSHIETRNCPTGDCDILTPAPCQMACPAGIDIPSYVSLIGQGRDAEAVKIIREDNPFPWICGLICTHPCEFMCVRGRIDQPISIMHLKAFAAERAMSERSYVNPPKAPDNGHRVCIIGAGPSGLTAAYYLGLKGYGVTVIEDMPMAGGMMMLGIPRFRLPREVIDREVGMIEDLGVEFRFNTRLGRDVTIEGLREEGFEAFYIAIGAHDSWKMEIPGEDDYPQVLTAVDLLHRVAMGERHKPGAKVAVIGGGNVAIDAARTLIRLGSEEVSILYRRTRSEMPANVEEVVQAEQEGVKFSFLTIPSEVVGDNGSVTGLKCVRAKLGKEDASGRRRPIPVEGSEYVLGVDSVVSAVGQKVNPEGLDPFGDLTWTRRATILADTVSMSTDEKGVFAGGDAILGPATVVEAIGHGKLAAEGIDRYLNGIPQPKMPPVPVRRRRIDWLEVPATTKMILKRPAMPHLKPDRRRVTFQQVELGYSEAQVREEARRCLRCDICKRCGECVEICRDKMEVDALHFGYLDFDHPGYTDYRDAAERCILCGACAANCPTRAITLEDRDDERILNLTGTILCREKLEHCEECGAVLGPNRYLDYIKNRTKEIEKPFEGRRLCAECGRRITAKYNVEITIPDVGNTQ